MYTMITVRQQETIKKKEIRSKVWVLHLFGLVSAPFCSRNTHYVKQTTNSGLMTILGTSTYFHGYVHNVVVWQLIK
jgi:hypothetical protein